jgi:hypothetical protein
MSCHPELDSSFIAGAVLPGRPIVAVLDKEIGHDGTEKGGQGCPVQDAECGQRGRDRDRDDRDRDAAVAGADQWTFPGWSSVALTAVTTVDALVPRPSP